MDDYFIKMMASILEDCHNSNKVYLSDFLAKTEQEAIISLKASYPSLTLIFDGKIGDSEYKKALIYPSDLKLKPDFKITIIEIKYNPRYLNLTHRNIMGTILSYGIKRNRLGDIVIIDKKAYFAISNEVSKYIIDNMRAINGVPVELVEANEAISVIDNGSLKTIFPNSNRVDAIISLAFGISREKSSQLVYDGFVKLNQKILIKPFQSIDTCDIISVLHKGRIKIIENNSTTRSGRIVMKIKIYR